MKAKTYIRRVLVAIDQLANAVFAGNPDSTISARTGRMSALTGKRYWVLQERLINYAFKPMDGERHCIKAWRTDRAENYYDAGVIAKVAMALTVVPSCLIIGTVLRIFFK